MKQKLNDTMRFAKQVFVCVVGVLLFAFTPILTIIFIGWLFNWVWQKIVSFTNRD